MRIVRLVGLSQALFVLSFDAGKGRLWPWASNRLGCSGGRFVRVAWVGLQSLLSMGVEASHDHASAGDIVFVVCPEDGTAVLSDFDLSVGETLEYGCAGEPAISLAVHLCPVLL